jgi:hypothetical protein
MNSRNRMLLRILLVRIKAETELWEHDTVTL